MIKFVIFIVVSIIFDVSICNTKEDDMVTQEMGRAVKRYIFRRSEARQKACGSGICK